MSRIKHRPWYFAQVLVTLFSLISVCYCFQNPYESKKCGELFSEDGFIGAKLELMDQDQSLNFAENYKVSNGWYNTSSIRVDSGCSMNLCNDTYFDGECKTLTNGSYGTSQLSSTIGFTIASVGCACEKECRCTDIFMRKTSCAHAYLNMGCNTCHAFYTDLEEASYYFPEDFQGKVKSLMLRKGCELTLYPEEDYKGYPKVITEEVVENSTTEFLSYECKCNNLEFVPRPPPPRSPNFPPFVDIPPTIKEIFKMFENPKYTKHEGLKAVVKSWQKRRSKKNAYILLLGTLGAGKTSAIKLLFDNSNITKVDDFVSATTNINEFKVTVPLDELGLANTELRVIDIPGLGDTRGVEQDAKCLATLDDFLSNHEELNDRIPNAVLIFHKFIDDQFTGEGSRYVKMIRGFDAFRERLTDENYSNVIHVFTHFSAAPEQIKRKPWSRLAVFKAVIEYYTTFPRPTIITVAENKGRYNDLKMVNGYYQLENKEFYPKNLFEQLEVITKNGEDPIGLGVFRAAFRDSDTFEVKYTTFRLVQNDGGKVQRYLRILNNTYLGIESTQVSRILEGAWDVAVQPLLENKYPDSLQYLQQSLHKRRIYSYNDIPRTTTDILQLLTALKHDEATNMLLETGLGIQPPIFPQNSIAGFSYNIFKDASIPETPFEIGELHLTDIGFMVPSFLTCKLEQSSAQNFIFVENQQTYIQERLRSIGVKVQISPTLFKGTPKPGYNIGTLAFRNGSSVLSAQRTFKRFQFVVNEETMLKKEFADLVKALPTFSENDYEAVTKWNDFFKTYGTHVVKSIHGGGAIEIQLKNNGLINKEDNKSIFSLINFIEDMTFFVGNNETSKDMNITLLKEGINHTLVFSGGNPQYHTNDFTKLSIEDAVDMMSNWQKSLKYSPTLLTSEMELIPISRVANKIGSNYEQEIQRVANIIFNSTLKYVPNSSPIETRITSARPTPIQGISEQTPVQAGSEQAHVPSPPPRELVPFSKGFWWQGKPNPVHKAIMSLQMTKTEHTLQLQQMEQERQKWEKEMVLMQADIRRHELQVANIDDEKREVAARRYRSAQRRYAEMYAGKQREWNDTLMEQRKAESARSDDVMKAILSLPERQSGNCLKAGTMIKMANGMQKPVEVLEAGDILVGKDLMQIRVLGVAHEFLFDQKFYGFDNSSDFVTNSHFVCWT